MFNDVLNTLTGATMAADDRGLGERIAEKAQELASLLGDFTGSGWEVAASIRDKLAESRAEVARLSRLHAEAQSDLDELRRHFNRVTEDGKVKDGTIAALRNEVDRLQNFAVDVLAPLFNIGGPLAGQLPYGNDYITNGLPILVEEYKRSISRSVGDGSKAESRPNTDSCPMCGGREFVRDSILPNHRQIDYCNKCGLVRVIIR